ncbi:ATP-dependent RNA helicase DHX30 [Lampetra planeri]
MLPDECLEWRMNRYLLPHRRSNPSTRRNPITHSSLPEQDGRCGLAAAARKPPPPPPVPPPPLLPLPPPPRPLGPTPAPTTEMATGRVLVLSRCLGRLGTARSSWLGGSSEAARGPPPPQAAARRCSGSLRAGGVESAAGRRVVAAAVTSSQAGGGLEAGYSDEQEALLQEFPLPKDLLRTVLEHVASATTCPTKLSYTNYDGRLKRSVLSVMWPVNLRTEGFGWRKLQAERHAAAVACARLKEQGWISANNKPLSCNEYQAIASQLGVPENQANSLALIPQVGDNADMGRYQRNNPAGRGHRGAPFQRTREQISHASEMAELMQKFPNSKTLLLSVVQIATASPSAEKHVRFTVTEQRPFECHLRLSWPQDMVFVAHAPKKNEAIKRACAMACASFKEMGLLDSGNRPLRNVDYNKTALQDMHAQHRRPTPIRLLPALATRLHDFLLQRENYTQSSEAAQVLDPAVEEACVRCVFTGRPYKPFTPEQAQELSEELLSRWRAANPPVTPGEDPLPILDHRDEILAALEAEDRRVLIVAGETGCGKTTKIPQLILESMVSRAGTGAHCNVVVTQPRRISAVSVCQRVRQELGPHLRRNIGYQVRMESSPPTPGGAVLFCTVGILLRKLQSNPDLLGVSHVLLDEVHERDVGTDFLLVLLRDVLRRNPRLRLLLASATPDTQRLAQYFGGATVLRVPGKLYPVTPYHLRNVCQLMQRHPPSKDSDDPAPDLDFVAEVVEFICSRGTPGGVLCFLPGWQEIRGVMDKLSQRLNNRLDKHLILPVHSSLSVVDQQAIFQRPPEGVRKVVLATNIAETAITIDDIVHVVDTGCHKLQQYDMRTQVSCLDTVWVSKTNVVQRRGRAGRCQPGFSYHLFSEEQFAAMPEFETPEILRTPLESLVLQVKLHTPHIPAAQFLDQALDRPNKYAVEEAVSILQEIGVLMMDESLTPLGARLAHMAVEPRLAKALVLATLFRCLYPVLVIISSLSRDPFQSGLQQRAAVNKARRLLAGETRSDHLAFVNALEEWRHAYGDRADEQHCAAENMLHPPAVRYVQGLMRQFSQGIHDANLVENTTECLHDEALCNEYCRQAELVLGVLAAALYPNIIQLRLGEVTREGKLRADSLVCRTRTGRVLLHSSTLNKTEEEFRSRYLVYYSAMKSNGRVFVRDSSMVHPLALLLMTDAPIHWREGDGDVLLTVGDGDLVRMACRHEDARLLLGLREALRSMECELLASSEPGALPADAQERHRQLLDILVETLNAPQEPFTARN